MSDTSLPTSEMEDSTDDFDDLYRSNAPLIYRFMFWRTRNEMLSEDLTSHVFEKAWRTRSSFTSGSSRAWLYRIARTTLIDYWRKKKDIADEDALSHTISSEDALDDALDKEMAIAELKKTLSKLPREMQQVVRLRFIEQQSARDTAERLNITEANVRVIQYRALKKLRNYLS